MQEALTNVAKHAAGATASRSASATDDGEIALDGARRRHAASTRSRSSSGFGLIGMRERLALVDGTLEIVSARGAGTTLRARIPAPRREARDGQSARATARG